MAPKSLRFEPLAEHFIPAILEIEAVSNTAPWSERSFQAELTNPQSVFRVAIEQGKVCGYAGLWTLVDEAHITTVAVAPDRRGQGIGRALTIEVLQEAKRLGMLCATLEVRRSNEPAIRLYEKLGFEHAAVRKGYYPDNREDALVMWLYHLENWSPSTALR
jgi:ribosomal-protein-alanine N-acetyltransferase